VQKYIFQPWFAPALGAVVFFATARGALAQGWQCYAQNPGHTAIAGVQSQTPLVIQWSEPVDLHPTYSGGNLYAHYGSPAITRANTILVPVKTGTSNGFEVIAYSFNAGTLSQVWTFVTDYTVPSCGWLPVCGITLTPNDGSVAVPGAGGTVYVRASPNAANGTVTQMAFYGISTYNSNRQTYNGEIHICTPITSDGAGNLYFGYVSTAAGIPSGLARISSTGAGTYTSAAAMTGDSSSQSMLYNCAPAISNDGSTVYVGVSNISPSSPNNYGSGYLCALNSTTLARTASVALQDPRGGYGAALVTNYSSASPTVGPDGDVYFGVLEAQLYSNNDRGWMLHYSANLSTTKLPSAFGWDATASVVPASAVVSYSGPSSYLLLTKYNNYAGIGTGNGVNKVAVVDPNTGMTDPVTGASVMNTVITVTGVTPDPNHDQTYPNAVREWCINSAAIDPIGKCAMVNSEDGKLYRWDFTNNALSAGLPLAAPTGEAYTPTLIGPDGAVYAINDSVVFALGLNSADVPAMPRGAGIILPVLLFCGAAAYLGFRARRAAVRA